MKSRPEESGQVKSDREGSDQVKRGLNESDQAKSRLEESGQVKSDRERSDQVKSRRTTEGASDRVKSRRSALGASSGAKGKLHMIGGMIAQRDLLDGAVRKYLGMVKKGKMVSDDALNNQAYHILRLIDRQVGDNTGTQFVYNIFDENVDVDSFMWSILDVTESHELMLDSDFKKIGEESDIDKLKVILSAILYPHHLIHFLKKQ